MADIEIKTNSPKVISELRAVQNEIKKTGTMARDTNAQSAASYNILSQSVINANTANQNMNTTLTATSTMMTSISLMLTTVTSQVNLLNASAALLNQTLVQGFINLSAINTALTLNTIELAANMFQSMMSTTAADMFTASTASSRAETEAFSQALAINTAAFLNNALALTANGIAQALTTIATQDNSKVTDESIEKTDSLSGVKGALAISEGILATVTAVTTGFQIANAIAAKANATAATIASIKLVMASNKNSTALAVEATAGIAAQSSKGLGALVIIPIILGAIAAGAAVLSTIMAFKGSKLANGGVATGTTIAMIGEGKYPEAVVPLGDSPQFASMKAGIASAVVQAMSGYGGSSRPIEVVVNIDSREIARATEKGQRLNSASKTATVGGVL